LNRKGFTRLPKTALVGDGSRKRLEDRIGSPVLKRRGRSSPNHEPFSGPFERRADAP
jgi:hypothetical protein